MELRHLETFVAVAEERSFSRAADRLHVVQSAVSATIRNLEREWGVTLFHRTTHRVELSPEGRALLGEARAAVQAAAAVGHAVDEVRGGLRGTLRVGIMQATQGAGGLSVAAVIAAFTRRAPGRRGRGPPGRQRRPGRSASAPASWTSRSSACPTASCAASTSPC